LAVVVVAQFQTLVVMVDLVAVLALVVLVR
jgi:hypothetical protein